ncbi:MAG: response regulator [Dokdonella sp.]
MNQHVVTDTASGPSDAVSRSRVLVVDSSRVVRMLLGSVLARSLPDVDVIAVESGEAALAHLVRNKVDLITIALRLPDLDGLELAQRIRAESTQHYVPIIVISGDVQQRLESRSLGDDVTDYFDKSLGLDALSQFIRGYVGPEHREHGAILYIEDSQVVTLATRRVLEQHGLSVVHFVSVEDALEYYDGIAERGGEPPFELVLTDVRLKGELSGVDLVAHLRGEFGLGRDAMPIIVMTADENPENQAKLLRGGANDLVSKPVDDRLLITKILFQLRVARQVRSRRRASA